MPLTQSPELGGTVQEDKQAVEPERAKPRGVRILLIVMILVFAALSAVQFWMESDVLQAKGSVSGVVVDPAGNPVPAAQIFVSGVESREAVDQDGSFEFQGIPAGAREVVVVVTPGPANSEVIIPVEISGGDLIDLGRIVFSASTESSHGGGG